VPNSSMRSLCFRFPGQNFLIISHLSMCATCTTGLILLDLIVLIAFGEVYKLWSSPLCSHLQPCALPPSQVWIFSAPYSQTFSIHARLEIFTALKIHVIVLWLMTPCSDVGYGCFRGPCCLHFQGEVKGAGKGAKATGVPHKCERVFIGQTRYYI
jgi:hypothetical protein